MTMRVKPLQNQHPRIRANHGSCFQSGCKSFLLLLLVSISYSHCYACSSSSSYYSYYNNDNQERAQARLTRTLIATSLSQTFASRWVRLELEGGGIATIFIYRTRLTQGTVHYCCIVIRSHAWRIRPRLAASLKYWTESTSKSFL